MLVKCGLALRKKPFNLTVTFVMGQATQNEGERPPAAPVRAAPNGSSAAAAAENNQTVTDKRDPTSRLNPRELMGGAAETVCGGSKEVSQDGEISASESKSQSDGLQSRSQPKQQKHMRLNSLKVTKPATKRKRKNDDVLDNAAASKSAPTAAKAAAAGRPKKFRGPQFMTVNGEKGARSLDSLSPAEAQASFAAHSICRPWTIASANMSRAQQACALLHDVTNCGQLVAWIVLWGSGTEPGQYYVVQLHCSCVALAAGLTSKKLCSQSLTACPSMPADWRLPVLQALLAKVEHRRGKKTVWHRALMEQAQHASLGAGGAQAEARSPIDGAHLPRTAAAAPPSSAAARGRSGPPPSAGRGAPERDPPAGAGGGSNRAAVAVAVSGVAAPGAPHSSAAPASHRAGDGARLQPAAEPPVVRAAGSGDRASRAGGGASAAAAGAHLSPALPHLCAWCSSLPLMCRYRTCWRCH